MDFRYADLRRISLRQPTEVRSSSSTGRYGVVLRRSDTVLKARQSSPLQTVMELRATRRDFHPRFTHDPNHLAPARFRLGQQRKQRRQNSRSRPTNGLSPRPRGSSLCVRSRLPVERWAGTDEERPSAMERGRRPCSGAAPVSGGQSPRCRGLSLARRVPWRATAWAVMSPTSAVKRAGA